MTVPAIVMIILVPLAVVGVIFLAVRIFAAMVDWAFPMFSKGRRM